MTHNAHLQFSQSLETISAQDISRYKWDFKETCKGLFENRLKTSSEYRNKLASYASILISSKETGENVQNELEKAKLYMKDAYNKSQEILKEIKHNIKLKTEEIEGLILEKIRNIIEYSKNYETEEKFIEECYSEKSENKDSGTKIIKDWLNPRVKEIYGQLDKLIHENQWNDETIVKFTVLSIENIIKELSLKCKTSIEY